MKEKTLGELRNEKERIGFIGRDTEKKNFKSLVMSGKLSKPILNLFGIGGIGKTWILNEYQRICRSFNIPSALVDIRVQRGTFFELLKEFRSQLGLQTTGGKKAFSEYDKNVKRMYKAEKKLFKLLKDKSALETATSDGLVSIASGAVGGLAGSLAGPGGTILGAGFGTASGKVFMNILGEKTISSLLRLGLSVDDAKFLVDLKDALTTSFKNGVNSISKQVKRVVLIFDTYEEITPALDEWVRDHLIPMLQTYVLIIISGRDHITAQDNNWHRYAELTDVHEIEKFTKKEAEEYLTTKGISDSALITKLLDYTERLPWAIALIFDMHNEGMKLTAETFDVSPYKHVVDHRVVSRFLRQIAETEMSQVMEVCTVARRFDIDLLKGVLKERKVGIYFDRLRRYSFVRTLNDGSLALHDIVRSFMNKDLQATSFDTYRNLNQCLYEYYRNKLISPLPEELKKRDTIECVYHALHADEDLGIAVFREIFGTLDVYRQFDFRDALLTELIRFDFNNVKNKLWQSYCKAYQFVNRGNWETAEHELSDLLSEEDLDPLLKCLAIDTLGELRTGQGMYASAVALYEQSIEIKQKLQKTDVALGLGQTLGKLREGYAILGSYSKAEKSAETNRSICQQNKDCQGEAWALKGLGDTYRLWGKTNLAIERLEESLILFRVSNDEYGIGHILTQLGRVYTHSGAWARAIKYLTEAKNIFEKLSVEYGRANTLLFLGNIARFKKQWDQAEDLYLKALAIHEKMDSKREIGPLWGSLGIVYLYQERFEEALKSLKKSLEMKQAQEYYRGVGITSIYFGDFYLFQNQVKQALDYYLKALKYAEQSISNYHRVESRIRIADSFRLLKQYEEMSEYIEKARNLSRYYGYPHQLARLNLVLGHTNIDKALPINAAVSYAHACQYAIKYNFYLLDEISDDVLRKMLQLIKLGNANQVKEIISFIAKFWQKNELEIVEQQSWAKEEIKSTKQSFLEKCKNMLKSLG